MSTPHSQKFDEDEDEDIIALRNEALISLKKRVHPGPGSVISQSSASNIQFHQEINHGRPMHDYPPRLMNGGEQMGYRAPRPGFSHHSSDMHPGPNLRQPVYNSMYHQDMLPRPTFGLRRPPFQQRPQMMPHIQPHVNPHFVAQNQAPRFPSVLPDLPPMHVPMSMETDEDMPILPDMKGAFEPTPPSRLSPRSAQFVAENREALRRQQRRRSFSTGRSRSLSPYKYRRDSRSRSRSPAYKAQISHIVRKRTRSKTPDNGYINKYNQKSRSPRRRSKEPEKRLSPKYSENDRAKRNRNFKFNGNGSNRDRHGNERKELDRKPRISPKGSDKDKKENNSNEEKKADEKIASPSENETKDPELESLLKTEQELEDELLASSDSEASIKEFEDDGLKMTLDAEDLDFLDDDEEESENEGRFKSKASSSANQQKKSTLNNFKPHSSNNFDRSRNDRNYSRHDYKRNKYNDKDDSRRDRKSSRSPLSANYRSKEDKRNPSPDRKQKKQIEARKSPVSRKAPAKEPVQSSKVLVVNKEKQEASKDEHKKSKNSKPLFKSTFKTVEAQEDEKRKDELTKKDERIRLVRGSVSSRVDTPKEDKSEKSKEGDTKRPAIMKRLGGYIKDSASKKATKAWAKEQAP